MLTHSGLSAIAQCPIIFASFPQLSASKVIVLSIQAHAVQFEDCSTTVLRNTNILLGMVCLYLLCAVYKALHPEASWQTCTQTVSHTLSIHTAAVVPAFPVSRQNCTSAFHHARGFCAF